LRYIKIEYYNRPKSRYIISVIFENYAYFVYNSMRIMHYNSKKDKNLKFSLLDIFENETLKEILEYF